MNTIQRAQSEPNLASLTLNNTASNQTRRHSFSGAIEHMASSLLKAAPDSVSSAKKSVIPATASKSSLEATNSQALAQTVSGAFALPTELARTHHVARGRHTTTPTQPTPANAPGAYRVPGIASTDDDSVLTVNEPINNDIEASNEHQQLLITNAYLVVDAEPHSSGTGEPATEEQLQQPLDMPNDQMDKCCTIL